MMAGVSGRVMADSPKRAPVIPGKFGWADIYANQVDSTADFYVQLFGWTLETLEDGYRVFRLDGDSVAGIVQRPRSAALDSDGATARWVPYIASADISASIKRARAAGAQTVIQATELEGRGEYALLRDGQGAYVGLVRPLAGSNSDQLVAEGDWIYARLFSPDPKAAAAFYGDAFGYKVVADDATLSEEDYVLIADGFNRGAILPLPVESKKPALWVGFVRVASVKDAVEQAMGLGGSVILKPQSDLLGGHVAIVADPEGAPIGLFEVSSN